MVIFRSPLPVTAVESGNSGIAFSFHCPWLKHQEVWLIGTDLVFREVCGYDPFVFPPLSISGGWNRCVWRGQRSMGKWHTGDTVPLGSALLLGTADLCECGQRVKTSLALSSVTGACWGLFFLCSSTAMLLNDFPVPTVLAVSHRHRCRCHICPLNITGLGKVLGNLWKRSKKWCQFLMILF